MAQRHRESLVRFNLTVVEDRIIDRLFGLARGEGQAARDVHEVVVEIRRSVVPPIVDRGGPRQVVARPCHRERRIARSLVNRHVGDGNFRGYVYGVDFRNGDASSELVVLRPVRGGQLLGLDPIRIAVVRPVPPVDVGRSGQGIIPTGPDDGGVARNGDAIAEIVTLLPVRGGQLLGFAPVRPVPPVDVGRAGEGGVAPGPDDGGVARNGDAIAEQAAVRGGQLLGFAPVRPVPPVDVSRALVATIAVGPDDGGIARNGNVFAEIPRHSHPVRGGQLLGFAPVRPVPPVDVGRSGVGIIFMGSDDSGIARNGDANAELVIIRPVRGDQLPGLDPIRIAVVRPVPPVDVGRAGVGIIVKGPDDGGVARNGDANAELVIIRPVRGGQLLGLDPGVRPIPPVDVGRAGVGIIAFGPDDGGVARNGDAIAEMVIIRPVRGGQLPGLDPIRIAVVRPIPPVDVGRAGLTVIAVRPDDGDGGRRRYFSHIGHRHGDLLRTGESAIIGRRHRDVVDVVAVGVRRHFKVRR